MNNSRYFIVFYSFNFSNKTSGTGNASVITENNEMFNSFDFTEYIISDNGFESIVINNFIEISRDEFNQYYDK